MPGSPVPADVRRPCAHGAFARRAPARLRGRLAVRRAAPLAAAALLLTAGAAALRHDPPAAAPSPRPDALRKLDAAIALLGEARAELAGPSQPPPNAPPPADPPPGGTPPPTGSPPPAGRADPYALDAMPMYAISRSLNEIKPAHTYRDQPVLMRPWIWNVYGANQAQARRLVDDLRRRIPNLKAGRYFSGISAADADAPAGFDIKLRARNAWLLQQRDGSVYRRRSEQFPTPVVDLTRPEVRKAMIDWWVRDSAGWDMICIDELVYKFANEYDTIVHTEQQWYDAVLALLKEYTALRGRPGYKPMIINVATRPEETWRELIPHVDGLMLEFALSNITSKRRDYREQRVKGEFAAFRAALDAGRTVLITNPNVWSDIDDGEAFSLPESAGPIFSAAVCLLSNPGEPMYFTIESQNPMYHGKGNDYRVLDFQTWRGRLGAPKGAMQWNGLVAARDFAHGRLELDISTNKPDVRITWRDDPGK